MRKAALIIAFSLIAPFAARADDLPRVLIETSLGDITLELDQAHAPATVDNFLRYVNEGHFDGTVVYRVVPGFVIQAGSWDADVHARPTARSDRAGGQQRPQQCSRERCDGARR